MRFQKSCGVVVSAFLLATAGLAGLGFAHPRPGGPEFVVRVGAPPPLVIPAPPSLVVVPGTSIYVAPDVAGDMLFYQGYWWWLNDGRWYRSYSYNGPWRHIVHERVPRSFYGFHPGFRHTYRPYHHLHHDEVMGHWRQWEHERHGGRHHRR